MKQLLLITFCSGIIGSQLGCSSWPPHGHGGMAEHHLNTYIPVEADHDLTPKHGLRFDLELLRRQLDVLVMEGAEYCFLASVIKGREREQRIARQLHGELFFDAANDILIQRDSLARLERQIDSVGKVCQPPGNIAFEHSTQPQHTTQQPKDLVTQLSNILNSDNQFAIDSYQINPKYIVRLAEATSILRKHPNIHLHIIGHTDQNGNSDYNADLSLKRAQQVARYLNIMGVTPSRITCEALGENSPLFEGIEPHFRLVNRRVTIRLIDSKSVNLLSEIKDGGN